jgi:hypothetical protein
LNNPNFVKIAQTVISRESLEYITLLREFHPDNPNFETKILTIGVRGRRPIKVRVKPEQTIEDFITEL